MRLEGEGRRDVGQLGVAVDHVELDLDAIPLVENLPAPVVSRSSFTIAAVIAIPCLLSS